MPNKISDQVKWLKKDSRRVGKGGLPPLVEWHSTAAGQATLPNHELCDLRFLL